MCAVVSRVLWKTFGKLDRLRLIQHNGFQSSDSVFCSYGHRLSEEKQYYSAFRTKTKIASAKLYLKQCLSCQKLAGGLDHKAWRPEAWCPDSWGGGRFFWIGQPSPPTSYGTWECCNSHRVPGQSPGRSGFLCVLKMHLVTDVFVTVCIQLEFYWHPNRPRQSPNQ